MTVPPVPFPTNFGGGGVVMDPGLGGALASSVAQVLAQQQLARENQFRMQQLAQVAQQQQALQAYYEGQVSIQSREQASREEQNRLQREAAAQVGRAQQSALGIQTPTATTVPSMPSTTGAVQAPAGLGNATQSMPGPFQQVLQGGAQALGGPQGEATLASIFTGVSPENMSAAVQGVQEVQKLAPSGPELPTSGKEFEYYQRLLSYDPEKAAMYKTLFLDKHPSTVINNIPQAGETEFSKEFAKAQVALLSKGEDEARKSIQAFPAMAEAYDLVKPGRAFTGFGANQLVALNRIAGATGYKPSKDRVADSQALLKLTRDQTLAYLQTRALGSGTAVSDRDREFMERQSAADLTLDPAAIKRIIRINVGAGVMRMQEAIQDLRDQAVAYPANARQLYAKANALQQQLAPIYLRYGQMREAENQIDEQQADQLFPMR